MTLPGFSTCDRCGGSGELNAVAALMDTLMKDSPQRVPCPDCAGTGLQPDPATVEAVARVLHRSECMPECPYPLNRVWRDYARTVLLAYARQAKEKP